jgi:DNA-binding response OmpR family regulator
MATVLVVDDEPTVREIVARYLEHDGHQALEAGDVDSARDALRKHSPNLVVLDLMLPGGSGLDLCREIRRQSEVPVIMLTARAEETDRIVGLELGADDYVTKPFSPRELTARVRTVLRRAEPRPDADSPLVFDGLEIDQSSREVSVAGEPKQLTAKEFDLLAFVARHPRQVFSRQQLMDAVWGYEAAFETGTVTVHVRRLREKIEPDPANPRWIQTVWGVGYRFAP